MLGWSLISGVVPVALDVVGVLALVALLAHRCDRAGWRRDLLLALSGTAIVLLAVAGVVAVVRPFTDPLPPVVWWSAAVVLLAVALVALSTIRSRPAGAIAPLAAAVLVLCAAGNLVNQHYGQYPLLRAALGLPLPNEVDLAQVEPVAATLATRLWR